jgi:hypothetical protein
MLWLTVAFVTLIGVGMIIWRNEVAVMIQTSMGARSHPGCAVVAGALLVALALAFALLYLAGVIPLRR